MTKNQNGGIKIAFTGKAGSGKTSAAIYLQNNYDFTIISFATKLKHFVDQMWGKYPKKRRGLLQEVGMKMREIDDKIWINFLLRETLLEKDPMIRYTWNNTNLVIDDMRFLNEAKIMRDFEFKIVRLERAETHRSDTNEKTRAHLSETEMDEIISDITLDAGRDLKELYSNLDKMMSYYFGVKKK